METDEEPGGQGQDSGSDGQPLENDEKEGKHSSHMGVAGRNQPYRTLVTGSPAECRSHPGSSLSWLETFFLSKVSTLFTGLRATWKSI